MSSKMGAEGDGDPSDDIADVAEGKMMWKGRLETEKLFLSDIPVSEYSNSVFPRGALTSMGSRDNSKNGDVPPCWRLRERMKTIGVVLCLCLNIGTDPPDAAKMSPCARRECWIDPKLMGPTKAIDAIAAKLVEQYKRWQPRARYKPLKDPTHKEVKKMCIQLRRVGKAERLLFHYNGHGVPKPTANGEIWVFNKNFTQYIPLGLNELSSWLRKPVIYVFDCPGAGILLPTMQRLRTKAFNSSKKHHGSAPIRPGSDDIICFAACGSDQRLPMNPAFPADVFTACLTTPIKMALRWFMHRNPLQLDLPHDIVDRIPGHLNDRKTPFGELNWIFTSITDTIAWNVLPLTLFQKLFRQDLLLASVSRNFLLADRIMRSLHCTPESIPALPTTARHPLWQSWDLAVEQCLSQLPAILAPSPLQSMRPSALVSATYEATSMTSENRLSAAPAQFQHSQFFREQLTAFEVWLRFVDVRNEPLSHRRPTSSFRGSKIRADTPEHLPIVLQVLLSQIHRVRALRLLAEFVDLGRWAVNLALSVGVHPYVLKLLHSPTPKLRPILVFIWAKILDLDVSCQDDLLKSNGHKYFLRQLRKTTPLPASEGMDSPSSTCIIHQHQRWLSAYVLARLMHRSSTGKRKCLSAKLHRIIVEILSSLESNDDHRLIRWLCVALAVQWRRCDAARRKARDENVIDAVLPLIESKHSAVRATATLAIGELFGGYSDEEREDSSDVPAERYGDELRIARYIVRLTSDCAVVPREQMLYALARLVVDPHHNKRFQAAAQAVLEHKRRMRSRKIAAQRAKAMKRKSASDVAANVSSSVDVKRSGDDGSNASASADSGIHKRDTGDATNGSGSSTLSVYARALRRMREQSLQVSEDDADSYVFIWRVVRNMKRNDPAQSVQRVAAALVKYVHTKMMERLERPKSTHFATKKDSPSPIGLSSSAKDSSNSQGNLRNIFGNSPSSTGAMRTTGSLTRYQSTDSLKKVASMDFKALTRGSTSTEFSGNSTEESRGPTTVANVSYVNVDSELDSFDLVSPLLDESCRRGVSWSLLRTSEEEDDPMSARGAVLRYRRQRNRSTARAATRMHSRRRDTETKFKFKQSSILDNGSIMSSVLLFHPYESTLVVATGRDEVKVWNYEDGENVGQFRNQNEKPSRITSLLWINPHDDALLLAGSDDGVVRVWRQPCEQQSLIAAFAAVPDLVAGRRGSGLVAQWQQSRGLLLAAGNSTLLRTWDMRTEMCVSCVSTGCPSSCVTSMASWDDGQSVVLGCGDGSLHRFDLRAPSTPSERESVQGHRNWVVNVHRQKGSQHLILSCSVSGDVRFWDNRNMSRSVATIKAHKQGEPATAFASHDYAPIMASGSHKQFIRIFDVRNTTMSRIHFHDGFLGQRIGPVSCLTFHPFKLCLAAGATDSIISIYTAKKA